MSLTVVVEKCNSASGHAGEWREVSVSVGAASRVAHAGGSSGCLCPACHGCGRNAHAKEKWNIGTRAPPHSSPS